MTVHPFKTKGQTALEEFVRDFKKGDFSTAFIILEDEEGLKFLPLTETPLHYIEYMCQECAHAIMHLEEE
jgi:hypothetical protein